MCASHVVVMLVVGVAVDPGLGHLDVGIGQHPLTVRVQEVRLGLSTLPLGKGIRISWYMMRDNDVIFPHLTLQPHQEEMGLGKAPREETLDLECVVDHLAVDVDFRLIREPHRIPKETLAFPRVDLTRPENL